VWRRRPLVACPGGRAKARGNLLGLHCLPAQDAIDQWLAPAHHSCRPGRSRGRIGEPERTGSFSGSPRLSRQPTAAGCWIIITAPAPARPLLDLHCIALNGWDGRPPGPTPVRDAVAAGWYVCQGPAAGARRPGEWTATARLSAVDSDAGPRGGGRRAV